MMKILQRGGARERARRFLGGRAAGTGLAAAVMLALALVPCGAAAQSNTRYSNNVIVNTDVLNSLGASPSISPMPYRPNYPTGGAPAYGVPVYGQQPYGQQPYGQVPYGQPGPNGLVVARPGALLFPPARNPRSLLAPQGPRNSYARGVGSFGSQLLPPPPRAQAALPTAQPRSQLLVPAASTAQVPSVTSGTQSAAQIPTISGQQNTQSLTRAATPPSSQDTIIAVPAPPPEPTIPAAPAATEVTTAQPAVVAVPEPAPVVVVEQSEPEPVTAEPADAVPTVAAVVAQPETESSDLPPPPEPEPEPGSADTQTAAASAAQTPAAGPGTSVLFDGGSTDLSGDSKQKLDALAALLTDNDSLRVQLLAFASGDGENANVARRLSLSRALVVRSYLIDQGIPATRMQVRALGNKSESGSPDRVDIKPQGG